MSEYPRRQAEKIKDALKIRRVVVISGARQTGKTTLLRQLSDKNTVYRSLDNTALFAAAKEDPMSFVKNSSGTLMIDEVQKVPALIPEIKQAVDNDNRSGQYLLTGSANLGSLPGVSESLAGRVKNIRLRPLTVGEIMSGKPQFLDRVFAGDFPAKIRGYDRDTIFNIAFRGGYPEAVRLTPKDRVDWHRDYIETMIIRDLKDIANIRRQNALKELVGILASWSGKLMELSAICAGLGISKSTAVSYINALEALYLFEKVPPWIKTDYDRVGRSPKSYMSDTGLMSSILGWKQDRVFFDSDRSGKLMETFVFQEIAAQVDFNGQCSLFHYRDRKNHEIDFLVERDDGVIAGIEVKAGQTVNGKDFEPQRWFKDNIVKDKSKYIGIVLYSGEDTLRFGDMLAVPTAALWL
jgi:predicted AAA+ superfamily ATPase